jgi:lysophospholipase L1-like esterase
MGDAIVGVASLVATPLLPILWLQGRYVRKHTPRLPGAMGPSVGTVSAAGAPLRLLVIGESPVAGVGAPDHGHALTGQIAAALATRSGRTVEWRAVGKIGATADVARTHLIPEVPPGPVDIIVLALGVNDVLQLHAPGRWTRDLTRLISDLRERVGAAPIVLASVPPMGRFPAFPQPLRGVLGFRAAALDRAARRCVATLARVAHSPAHLDPAGGMFGPDRFHPSIQGYRRWGSQLAESIVSLLTESVNGPAQQGVGAGKGAALIRSDQ